MKKNKDEEKHQDSFFLNIDFEESLQRFSKVPKKELLKKIEEKKKDIKQDK